MAQTLWLITLSEKDILETYSKKIECNTKNLEATLAKIDALTKVTDKIGDIFLKLKKALALRASLADTRAKVDELAVQYQLAELPEELQNKIETTSQDFFEVLKYISDKDWATAYDKLDVIISKYDRIRYELLTYLCYALLDEGKIFFDSWAARIIDDSETRIEYADFQEKIKDTKTFEDLEPFLKQILKWKTKVDGKRKEGTNKLLTLVVATVCGAIALFGVILKFF